MLTNAEAVVFRITDDEYAVKMIFPNEKYSLRLFRFVIWFLHMGETLRASPASLCRRAYSADYDFPYIYAAFMQVYRIDLTAEKLHYWKYRALLRGLKDTKFNDIVSWRTDDIDESLPQNRKDFLYEMQEIFELPKNIYETQKISEAKKFFERK